ncbi:MAG TPA: 3-dehydroquinate synthase [Thermoanaerobaculia bacterium]
MTPFLTIQQTSASYPVFVGRGILAKTGELVSPRGKVFVITSPELRERFGEPVVASFGGRASLVLMEEGEANKTIDTANAVVTRLIELDGRRDSMAVVVGGGMIGDTAGFAAAIFLRGIDLVHVPTTLLAQVDSSIGGKVAVNHPKGKNLVGAFHPPAAVVADTDLLATLPRAELLSGLFEALKGGVIRDPALFELFEDRRDEMLARDADVIDALVRKKIAVKAEIVSSDERENDLRRLLNYGHTIAHGIEAALGYAGLTHGEAVAWGMIGANAIAVRRGILSQGDAARIERAILQLGPQQIPRLDRQQVLAATAHDKKNTGDSRVMVFPSRIGDCSIVSDVTEKEISYGIDAVLERQGL